MRERKEEKELESKSLKSIEKYKIKGWSQERQYNCNRMQVF